MRPRLLIGLSLLLGLLAPAFGGDNKAPFQATPFEGRKSKSDRVVVMELFTGAQCPPCVAADMAFDVLGETYKTSDLVQLQYHVHIPGPDPMTNPDTEARRDYYVKVFPKYRGVPASFFNGKPNAYGGGPAAAAEKKYLAYRKVIDPLLEDQAGAKIVASATRKGDKVVVEAQVSGLANPGPDKRLRLALVEKSIRYTGGNKLPVHHQVVRALLGGPNGFAVEGKDLKLTTSIDLMELRQRLNRYLDEYAATKRPFPNKNRPLDFNGLRVVAFVQDDANQEILQGVQVDVNDR